MRRVAAEKYNEAHPFGPSDNTKFNEKSLEKQEKITKLAKENRPVKEVAAEAEVQAQAENEVEAGV